MDKKDFDNVKPVMRHPDEIKGTNFEIKGRLGVVRVLMSGKESNGNYTFTCDTYEKGVVNEPHMHRNHEEVFSILEGEMEWHIGGSTFAAKPGNVVFVPKMTPHNFKAVTDCKVNMIWSPAGVEHALEEYKTLSQEEKKDDERMKEYGERHDIIEV